MLLLYFIKNIGIDLDIVELFLNVFRTIAHMFEIAVDLLSSKHKVFNTIFALVLGGCLIYFFKIDSFSDASPFPLALFATAGIYLAYTLTSWFMYRTKE